MQHRLKSLTIKVGLPVLVGQFLFDWISGSLPAAASHLPVRAFYIFAVLLLWTAFREQRERKNRIFS
jgi:hypothetical protein